ncbi:hypothetical protein VOLCADRAFT_88634 [Volvox carteri f. nagariensis]|uniref:Uncharacterized protein n=1 Tax=Volvox carteri f. nagariensis TaxID=3068 RepID=D8TPI9_VOLCA|nr:uncharacterized protein VOLCADRAFT_88634 [Volvox carteri f. nagariensis]EFJ50623.1 hypothetical protein VOLCADRAFT_88634 [Volvox carteri f. nagariensis]|eukprot:XP_002948216.1 hypothetical protein VOLCADRAFT_88634 [Volvox carteri f. nagariensis]
MPGHHAHTMGSLEPAWAYAWRALVGPLVSSVEPLVCRTLRLYRGLRGRGGSGPGRDPPRAAAAAEAEASLAPASPGSPASHETGGLTPLTLLPPPLQPPAVSLPAPQGPPQGPPPPPPHHQEQQRRLQIVEGPCQPTAAGLTGAATASDGHSRNCTVRSRSAAVPACTGLRTSLVLCPAVWPDGCGRAGRWKGPGHRSRTPNACVLPSLFLRQYCSDAPGSVAGGSNGDSGRVQGPSTGRWSTVQRPARALTAAAAAMAEAALTPVGLECLTALYRTLDATHGVRKALPPLSSVILTATRSAKSGKPLDTDPAAGTGIEGADAATAATATDIRGGGKGRGKGAASGSGPVEAVQQQQQLLRAAVEAMVGPISVRIARAHPHQQCALLARLVEAVYGAVGSSPVEAVCGLAQQLAASPEFADPNPPAAAAQLSGALPQHHQHQHHQHQQQAFETTEQQSQHLQPQSKHQPYSTQPSPPQPTPAQWGLPLPPSPTSPQLSCIRERDLIHAALAPIVSALPPASFPPEVLVSLLRQKRSLPVDDAAGAAAGTARAPVHSEAVRLFCSLLRAEWHHRQLSTRHEGGGGGGGAVEALVLGMVLAEQQSPGLLFGPAWRGGSLELSAGLLATLEQLGFRPSRQGCVDFLALCLSGWRAAQPPQPSLSQLPGPTTTATTTRSETTAPDVPAADITPADAGSFSSHSLPPALSRPSQLHLSIGGLGLGGSGVAAAAAADPALARVVVRVLLRLGYYEHLAMERLVVVASCRRDGTPLDVDRLRLLRQLHEGGAETAASGTRTSEQLPTVFLEDLVALGVRYGCSAWSGEPLSRPPESPTAPAVRTRHSPSIQHHQHREERVQQCEQPKLSVPTSAAGVPPVASLVLLTAANAEISSHGEMRDGQGRYMGPEAADAIDGDAVVAEIERQLLPASQNRSGRPSSNRGSSLTETRLGCHQPGLRKPDEEQEDRLAVGCLAEASRLLKDAMGWSKRLKRVGSGDGGAILLEQVVYPSIANVEELAVAQLTASVLAAAPPPLPPPSPAHTAGAAANMAEAAATGESSRGQKPVAAAATAMEVARSDVAAEHAPVPLFPAPAPPAPAVSPLLLAAQTLGSARMAMSRLKRRLHISLDDNVQVNTRRREALQASLEQRILELAPQVMAAWTSAMDVTRPAQQQAPVQRGPSQGGIFPLRAGVEELAPCASSPAQDPPSTPPPPRLPDSPATHGSPGKQVEDREGIWDSGEVDSKAREGTGESGGTGGGSGNEAGGSGPDLIAVDGSGSRREVRDAEGDSCSGGVISGGKEGGDGSRQRRGDGGNGTSGRSHAGNCRTSGGVASFRGPQTPCPQWSAEQQDIAAAASRLLVASVGLYKDHRKVDKNGPGTRASSRRSNSRSSPVRNAAAATGAASTGRSYPGSHPGHSADADGGCSSVLTPLQTAATQLLPAMRPKDAVATLEVLRRVKLPPSAVPPLELHAAGQGLIRGVAELSDSELLTAVAVTAWVVAEHRPPYGRMADGQRPVPPVQGACWPWYCRSTAAAAVRSPPSPRGLQGPPVDVVTALGDELVARERLRRTAAAAAAAAATGAAAATTAGRGGMDEATVESAASTPLGTAAAAATPDGGRNFGRVPTTTTTAEAAVTRLEVEGVEDVDEATSLSPARAGECLPAAAGAAAANPMLTALRMLHRGGITHPRLALAVLGVLPDRDRYGGGGDSGAEAEHGAPAAAAPVAGTSLPALLAVREMLSEGMLSPEQVVELVQVAAKHIPLPPSPPPPLPPPTPPSPGRVQISPPQAAAAAAAVARAPVRQVSRGQATEGATTDGRAVAAGAATATTATTAKAVDLVLFLRSWLLDVFRDSGGTEPPPLALSIKALQEVSARPLTAESLRVLGPETTVEYQVRLVNAVRNGLMRELRGVEQQHVGYVGKARSGAAEDDAVQEAEGSSRAVGSGDGGRGGGVDAAAAGCSNLSNGTRDGVVWDGRYRRTLQSTVAVMESAVDLIKLSREHTAAAATLMATAAAAVEDLLPYAPAAAAAPGELTSQRAAALAARLVVARRSYAAALGDADSGAEAAAHPPPPPLPYGAAVSPAAVLDQLSQVSRSAVRFLLLPMDDAVFLSELERHPELLWASGDEALPVRQALPPPPRPQGLPAAVEPAAAGMEEIKLFSPPQQPCEGKGGLGLSLAETSSGTGASAAASTAADDGFELLQSAYRTASGNGRSEVAVEEPAAGAGAGAEAEAAASPPQPLRRPSSAGGPGDASPASQPAADDALWRTPALPLSTSPHLLGRLPRIRLLAAHEPFLAGSLREPSLPPWRVADGLLRAAAQSVPTVRLELLEGLQERILLLPSSELMTLIARCGELHLLPPLTLAAMTNRLRVHYRGAPKSYRDAASCAGPSEAATAAADEDLDADVDIHAAASASLPSYTAGGAALAAGGCGGSGDGAVAGHATRVLAPPPSPPSSPSSSSSSYGLEDTPPPVSVAMSGLVDAIRRRMLSSSGVGAAASAAPASVGSVADQISSSSGSSSVLRWDRRTIISSDPPQMALGLAHALAAALAVGSVNVATSTPSNPSSSPSPPSTSPSPPSSSSSSSLSAPNFDSSDAAATPAAAVPAPSSHGRCADGSRWRRQLLMDAVQVLGLLQHDRLSASLPGEGVAGGVAGGGGTAVEAAADIRNRRSALWELLMPPLIRACDSRDLTLEDKLLVLEGLTGAPRGDSGGAAAAAAPAATHRQLAEQLIDSISSWLIRQAPAAQPPDAAGAAGSGRAGGDGTGRPSPAAMPAEAVEIYSRTVAAMRGLSYSSHPALAQLAAVFTPWLERKQLQDLLAAALRLEELRRHAAAAAGGGGVAGPNASTAEAAEAEAAAAAVEAAAVKERLLRALQRAAPDQRLTTFCHLAQSGAVGDGALVEAVVDLLLQDIAAFLPWEHVRLLKAVAMLASSGCSATAAAAAPAASVAAVASAARGQSVAELVARIAARLKSRTDDYSNQQLATVLPLLERLTAVGCSVDRAVVPALQRSLLQRLAQPSCGLPEAAAVLQRLAAAAAAAVPSRAGVSYADAATPADREVDGLIRLLHAIADAVLRAPMEGCVDGDASGGYGSHTGQARAGAVGLRNLAEQHLERQQQQQQQVAHGRQLLRLPELQEVLTDLQRQSAAAAVAAAAAGDAAAAAAAKAAAAAANQAAAREALREAITEAARAGRRAAKKRAAVEMMRAGASVGPGVVSSTARRHGVVAGGRSEYGWHEMTPEVKVAIEEMNAEVAEAKARAAVASARAFAASTADAAVRSAEAAKAAAAEAAEAAAATAAAAAAAEAEAAEQVAKARRVEAEQAAAVAAAVSMQRFWLRTLDVMLGVDALPLDVLAMCGELLEDLLLDESGGIAEREDEAGEQREREEQEGEGEGEGEAETLEDIDWG